MYVWWWGVCMWGMYVCVVMVRGCECVCECVYVYVVVGCVWGVCV